MMKRFKHAIALCLMFLISDFMVYFVILCGVAYWAFSQQR